MYLLYLTLASQRTRINKAFKNNRPGVNTIALANELVAGDLSVRARAAECEQMIVKFIDNFCRDEGARGATEARPGRRDGGRGADGGYSPPTKARGAACSGCRERHQVVVRLQMVQLSRGGSKTIVFFN